MASRRCSKVIFFLGFCFLFIHYVTWISSFDGVNLIRLGTVVINPTSHGGLRNDSIHMKLRLALLLQQSPVAPNDQPTRLAAIDTGWAQWGGNNDKFQLDIHVPKLHLQQFPAFNNIIVNPIEGSNPFEKMIELFFGSMFRGDRVYDWIVFGNDHSFFIPSNLYCFLKPLDAHSIVYSGNRLGIRLGDSFVNLASGGAGAVLSKTSLLCVLLSWTVLNPPYIARIIGRQGAHRGINGNVAGGAKCDMSEIIYLDSSTSSHVIEGIARVIEWIEQISLSTTPISCSVSRPL